MGETMSDTEVVHLGEFDIVTWKGKGFLLQQRIEFDDVAVYECFKEPDGLSLTVVYENHSFRGFDQFHTYELEITEDSKAKPPVNFCR
jgi:hypothetical protein